VAEELTGYACTAEHWRRCTGPRCRRRRRVAGARLVLVLEDIVDHTNVGAAFRAAAGSAPTPCWSRRAAPTRSTVGACG
jgi:tRNA G18 (ribose-2'-O)-methylase SpoU